MVRTCAAALLWLSFASLASAQVQPTSSASTNQAAPAKQTAKKTAPNARSSAIPTSPAVGPCKYGIITATEDVFTVQTVGITVFGNEYAEVTVPWGFDDLIFARLRAAAGSTPLRRITYPKGTFDSYYHPKSHLFRNQGQELAGIVRQITRKGSCERYLVATRFEGQLQGTNQSLNGIGVLRRGAGFLTSTWVFANVAMSDFDGQTFETRRHNVSLEAVLTRMAASLTSDPSLRKIDNSAFPEPPAEAAKSVVLRDAARNFLAERLDKYLPDYFKE
jgi:hypothetical protein